jgi:hypothetical protein
LAATKAAAAIENLHANQMRAILSHAHQFGLAAKFHI